jgi:hypothetical protein
MVPISMVILRRSFQFNEFMVMAMVLTETNALNGDEEEEEEVECVVVSGDDMMLGLVGPIMNFYSGFV